MQLETISCSEAKEQGLKRYFTGKPCSNGHVAERAVSNWTCWDCIDATQKELREKYPEVAKARADRWMSKNHEQFKLSCRTHYRKNSDIYKHRARQRTALKKGAIGSYSIEDILKLEVKQNGVCASPVCQISIMGQGPHRHVDHKKPLSKGGSNWPRNLQLLCAPCNIGKGTKTNKEWRAYLARYRSK